MALHLKMLTAAVVAALALSLAGNASALRSLSISGSTTLNLNSRLTFAAEGFEVICNATITKTVSRVIPKIDHVLVGKITRVDTPLTKPEANCRATGGLTLTNIEVRGLEREENGRILKGVILGTLPRITGMLFLIDRWQLSFTTTQIGRCGYESPERGLPELAGVEARGNIVNLTIEPNRLVRLEGGFLCPPTLEVVGTLVPLQTTNLRLI
jgi:hypothetical protein